MIYTSHSSHRPHGMPHPGQRHRVTEDRPNWALGLYMVVVFSLLIGFLDEADNAVELRERARLAEVKAEQSDMQRVQLERRPALRLEGDAWVCNHWNVRPEWEAAAAGKCAELASFLRLAAK